MQKNPKINKSFNNMISALYVYWPTCSLNIGICRWKTHIGRPLVLSTHPISCSGENPSPVKEHQARPVQTDQSRTPCLGRGTFIPQQLGVMVWWEGGVGEIWVPPPPRSQSPNLKMAKQSSQHLWRAPCTRHELDMETTCICIHVTAGSMSPSQPRPMTERLLF